MHRAVQIGGETFSAPHLTPSDLPPPKRLVRHLDRQSKAAAQQSVCWLVVQAASRDLSPDKAFNHADVNTDVAKIRGA